MADGALWIDTDMGFDDLAALCLIADSDRSIAGVSVVAGNVSLDRAVQSALSARAEFGWTFPVHPGARGPIEGPAIDAGYVLGEDGMRSAGRRLPQVEAMPDEMDAVSAMADWVDGGGRQILALGPLTNLATLVTARPDLARRIEVTWMGGAACGGNHTAAAEFNAAADPEALAVLLDADVSFSMVGLDACRQVQVTVNDVEELRALAGEGAALLGDLFEGYVRISDEGRRPMALYDPVAAATLVDPEAVTFVPARLDAELAGTHTRGMTVIEWRERKAAPNARIATRVDAGRIRAAFLSGLRNAAARGAR